MIFSNASTFRKISPLGSKQFIHKIFKEPKHLQTRYPFFPRYTKVVLCLSVVALILWTGPKYFVSKPFPGEERFYQKK